MFSERAVPKSLIQQCGMLPHFKSAPSAQTEVVRTQIMQVAYFFRTEQHAHR